MWNDPRPVVAALGMLLWTGTHAQITPEERPQGPPCTLFVHGTFDLRGDRPGKDIRIVRRGSKQIEHAPEGYRSITRVKWLDDCTYQLYDRRVKGGSDPHTGHVTDTLTIRITDTWYHGYSYQATSNFSDLELMGTMELVQPKAGGFSIGF